MTEPKEIKLLQKNQFNDWLKELTEYTIWAPVQRDNYSEFAEIKKLSEIDLSFRNTVKSPKDIILAQTKTLYKFTRSSKAPELTATVDDNQRQNKQMILGIRPCDAHAYVTIDKTFDAEFKDPYYISARNRTTMVGLACNEPDINCFCTSVGFDPQDGSATDVMIIDLDDSYLFKIYTEKGLDLTEKYSELFTTPSPEQLKLADDICARATAGQHRKMDTAGKPERLDNLFESDYWDKISRKCLGCGICTYLCPTCYCFDITDENWGNKGQRVRTWDSCMFAEYTVHASGYNPRPARLNRLRNRIYHKFKYYPDLYDMYGCIGCGRCIRYCPVNIDIIDIINELKEINPEGDSE